ASSAHNILGNSFPADGVLEYRPAEILPLGGPMLPHPARLCRPRRSPRPTHPRLTLYFTCFPDLESKDLKRLSPDLFRLARYQLSRFAPRTRKSAAFPLQTGLRSAG